MMRSMFSAVSGLKVHQTKMDVIGNNIANVNTVGYKSQRVTFTDVFSQTLQSASAASDATGRGGLNPMQVGLGVSVSSIDTLMTQGAAERTDNPFDVMVDGDGFLVVADASGTYFSRAGALRVDDEGNLINPSGLKVQGWKSQYNEETNAYEIVKGEVESINLSDPTALSASPTLTSKAQLSGNINASAEEVSTTVSFYDSLGTNYTANLTLTKNNGTWSATVDSIKDGSGNALTDPAYTISETFSFDANGKLVTTTTGGTTTGSTLTLSTGDSSGTKISTQTGANFSDIAIDISSLTSYATKSNVTGKSLNGNSAGTMTSYSMGADGKITAYYDNGDTRVLAQVATAEFVNPAGLEKVGDNLYRATANSGDFDGIGIEATFQTGVLEMSNVDLSTEFTQMITTQRGFQANSRIISVSDEMLQELANLK